MIKCVHTVASIERNQGGPSRTVPALCEALSSRKVSVRLFASVIRDASAQRPSVPNTSVEYHLIHEKSGLQRLLRSPFAFRRHLAGEISGNPPDIVHDHGLWLPSNHSASVIALKSNIRFVVSPRGMLTQWALEYNRRRKRMAWHLYQRRALGRADLLHATSYGEAAELRRLGVKTPIAVIPNGVELPAEFKSEIPSERNRRVLFLSRIHPKKGLSNLIKAWAKVVPVGWEMIVAGPDENGHRAELERLIRALGLADQISFLGPVRDEEKWRLYKNAELFVLPTHSENFGVVVAEALASGLPVITTKGAPWHELETHGCGWWIDDDVVQLAEAIRGATGLSDDTRLRMGQCGRRLIHDKYSWSRVSQQMYNAYAWLLGHSKKPPEIVN